MTLNFSEAKSYVPATKEETLVDVSYKTMKKVFAKISKRFWAYTSATSDIDTKPFDGLL